MRKYTLILLFCAVPHLFAQSIEQRAANDEIVRMRDEEPAMQRAFRVARDGLDQFLRIAETRAPEHSGFALKVAIAQGSDIEYFWVNNFQAKTEGKFEGEINNEPRTVRTVRLGQRYAFSRSQIVDWTYIDKQQRRMIGNFTLCALLTKEPRDQAEAVRRRYKLDCSQVAG